MTFKTESVGVLKQMSGGVRVLGTRWALLTIGWSCYKSARTIHILCSHNLQPIRNALRLLLSFLVWFSKRVQTLHWLNLVPFCAAKTPGAQQSHCDRELCKRRSKLEPQIPEKFPRWRDSEPGEKQAGQSQTITNWSPLVRTKEGGLRVNLHVLLQFSLSVCYCVTV